MAANDRRPKKFTRAQKQSAIHAVQEWFRRERDEDVGELAAELLIDALGPTIGRLWYNEAIHDARSVVADRMSLLDEELFALEQLPEVR
jgi:uncharacterized protein (DUF2164 family)